jgi:hypothetical protein
MTPLHRAAAAVVLLAMLEGCAGPRIVSSMSTPRTNAFRLLYTRNLGLGATEQGIIDCQAMPESGAITNCQPVGLVFKED